MLQLSEEIRISIAKFGGMSTAKALRATHPRLEPAGSTEVFRSIPIDLGSPQSIEDASEFALSRLVWNLECLVIKVRGTYSNNKAEGFAETLTKVLNVITLSTTGSGRFRKVIIRFDRPYTRWSGLFVQYVASTIFHATTNESPRRKTGRFHIRLEGVLGYHIMQLCEHVECGDEETQKAYLNCLNWYDWSLQAEVPECFPGDVEKWQEVIRLYQPLTSFELNAGSRMNPIHLEQILEYLKVKNAARITIRAPKLTYRKLQACLSAELMKMVTTKG